MEQCRVNARLILAATALALGLALLGYVWPQPSPDAELVVDDNWTLPATTPSERQTDLPANLATYWPGRKPTSSTVAEAAAADSQREPTRHDWKLIGVIRQGDNLSALVQDPQRNILMLSPGDRLDEQRSVSELKLTSLRWRDDEGGTGELQLYPEPAAE